MDWSWIDWLAVAALGGVAGASELVSRYKDDPWASMKSWPAAFYVALNCAASITALGLIHHMKEFSDSSRWTQILLAGVSAMAFFRTSLFVVRAGDRDVGVGPSGFLQIFLTAADRSVDRKRAQARSQAVVEAMRDVDCEKAKDALPPYCLALLQNVSEEDQRELGRRRPAAASARAVWEIEKGRTQAAVGPGPAGRDYRRDLGNEARRSHALELSQHGGRSGRE